jgi:hypothetical protein
MQAAVVPTSVHVPVPALKLQVLLGAVHRLLRQHGCPIPPQVPHEPAMHMLPMPAHSWPGAAQRPPKPMLRRQQPPPGQLLFGQQG